MNELNILEWDPLRMEEITVRYSGISFPKMDLSSFMMRFLEILIVLLYQLNRRRS